MGHLHLNLEKLYKKGGINTESLINYLNNFSLIILAVGAIILAVLKVYKNTKKEIDDIPKKVKKQASTNSVIMNEMELVKESLNADRIQVYDFHNGGHYANGRSALKTSCTYEVCRNEIASKQYMLQSIPLSCISKFINALLNEEKLEVKKLEEIKETMPATYQLKKDMEIIGFYDVVLNNKKGEPIGFLAIQYVKNQYNIKSEKDKEKILKLKFFIENQLEFLNDKK